MDNYRRIELMNKIATGLQKKANLVEDVTGYTELKRANETNMQTIKNLEVQLKTLQEKLQNSENVNAEQLTMYTQALAALNAEYDALNAKLTATTGDLNKSQDALSKSQGAFKGLSTAAGAGVGIPIGTGVGLSVNKMLGNTSLKSKIIASLIGATTFGSAGAWAGNKYSDQIADAAYAAKNGVETGVKATGDFVKSTYDSASNYINDLIKKIKA